MLKRLTVFVYGVVCYLVFFATFLYAIGFIGNVWVPKSMDSGPQVPLYRALLINLALLAVFALQHSIMARQWFKDAWTKLIPKEAERSTYVLFSSLALLLLFWKWEPMGGVVWSVDNPYGNFAIQVLYGLGWLTVLVATFLINHFDLFGLRQVWFYLNCKDYEPPAFRTPGLYKLVRHPLYVGWLMVFWSAPVMTVAHLVFAVMTTAYILVAIQFEERDLVKMHAEYAEYRKQVPMLIPIGGTKQPVKAEVHSVR